MFDIVFDVLFSATPRRRTMIGRGFARDGRIRLFILEARPARVGPDGSPHSIALRFEACPRSRHIVRGPHKPRSHVEFFRRGQEEGPDPGPECGGGGSSSSNSGGGGDASVSTSSSRATTPAPHWDAIWQQQQQQQQRVGGGGDSSFSSSVGSSPLHAAAAGDDDDEASSDSGGNEPLLPLQAAS